MRWEAVGVRASEVLDGMPLREADARRCREWIGAARSRSHGAGVVLVGVVLDEGERAEAGEARCGEWDGAEAQAPLASAAATHQTASRPNAPLPPPTSPDGAAALAGAPRSTWRRRHRAHRRRIRPREHRIQRAEGRAELGVEAQAPSSPPPDLALPAPDPSLGGKRRQPGSRPGAAEPGLAGPGSGPLRRGRVRGWSRRAAVAGPNRIGTFLLVGVHELPPPRSPSPPLDLNDRAVPWEANGWPCLKGYLPFI